MTPTLNWKEIARLTDLVRAEIGGMHVDRIIVPERPYFPGGYVKGEWVMRLTSRKQECVFLFSIRTRHPYFAIRQGKGPKSAPEGTRSPFDLAVSKHIKGARLLEITALPRERMVVLWFTAEGKRDDEERLGLALNLIPALPEAFLVRGGKNVEGWPIIARSRTIRDEAAQTFTLIPPDGSRAPEDMPVRDELFRDAWEMDRAIERALRLEAFELRLAAAQRLVRERVKQAKDRIRQTETALREAEHEADWQHYGDLLKNALMEPPPIVEEKGPKGVVQVRRVYDFRTEQYAIVPCDPKLNPQAQVEKFFSLARRKGRRIEEARTRLSTWRETLAKLESLLATPLPVKDAPESWKGLEKFERAAGLAVGNSGAGAASAAPEKKKGPAWLGKTFVSKDGASIYVGRSKDENLELTFKHARGNDLWMHVRGRPGSHVLIPLNSGKSASLETLLDAAVLCIFYSGGEKWGKTEVDYTFKKYVKRIKDSTEASYVSNKTLIVEPDPARLKRLLEQKD